MAAALGSVADANRDAQALALRRLGHLRRKGQIAAHMAGHLPVVDPDGGDLIHGAEMEQQTLAHKALRQRHRAPIPEVLPRFQAALHPGEGRLRRKGHQDLAVKALGEAAGRIDRVIPGAVQVHPVLPHHLRPGIFGQGQRAVHALGPYRCQVHVSLSFSPASYPFGAAKSVESAPKIWESDGNQQPGCCHPGCDLV